MSSQPHIVAANPAIGPHGDLHIYTPEGEGTCPFVLGIHGGAWRNGDQTSYQYLWPKLERLGFGLVLASYRRRQEAPFPAPYDDLIFTLRWLKEHGTNHGLDVERCALFGASAGGHLCMLVGLRTIKENLPAPKLRGLAQYCGIMDLRDQYKWDVEREATMTPEFMIQTPDENPDLYSAASPVDHITSDLPPIWMAHGTADLSVPLDQSRKMVEGLRAQGNDVIYHEASGLAHTLREVDHQNVAVEPLELLFERDILRFFARVLA